MKCHLCEKEFANELEVRKHLHKCHGFTPEESYCYFHKDCVPNICPQCGKKTKFLKNKYTKFCSRNCIMRYNASNKDIISKRNKTNLEKYGNENLFQSKSIKEKIKKINLEKYGAVTPIANTEVRNKAKNTMLKKYGVEQYNNIKKIKKTVKEKYNVSNVFQLDEIKEKSKITKMEKYGDENYNNSSQILATKLEKYGKYQNTEKYIDTMQSRYGINHPSQSQEFIKRRNKTVKKKYGGYALNKKSVLYSKVKESIFNKYGVEYPSQSELIKEKIRNTCRARFNNTSYLGSQAYKDLYADKKWVSEILLKRHKTLKENNSYNKSKEEDEIYDLLVKKYPDTIRQYRSKLYPFNCDFYIPSTDTYIEYNGIWTHGHEPYNKNNELHQMILEDWNVRAKTSIYYKNAIKVWTNLDIRKREIARQNNINFVEFWNVEEVIEWLDKK